MVPHLTTALTGSINELEQRMLESLPAIERWFRLEWMEHTPPFYTSVDLRNAGFKLSPVATDLFPSGFNHLNPEMVPLAVQAAMAAIEKICPEAKNLLLIPGPETSDSFYLAGMERLVQIFTQAGLNVRMGTMGAEAVTLNFPESGDAVLEPVQRKRGRLGLKDFDPCTILLNDELSQGVPHPLLHLHEQYLLPPLHAGWTVRRKSRHFHSYEEVAKKFAKLLGMDPWLINPMFASCGELDVATDEGLECVRTHADALLTKVRRKYKEYGINERPFVVIKTDNGGHGQGTLMLRDVKDLDHDGGRIAQRLRQARQGGSAGETPAPTGVLVQEGVPTMERIHKAMAEPVVSMIDRYVVGGYYRVHAERGPDEDLCGPGSSYVPLAFAPGGQLPKLGTRPGASAPNRFYMYGVIGRLAMLAASYELEASDPEADELV